MTDSCEDRIQKILENRIDDWSVLAEIQNDAASINAETKEKAESLGFEFEDDWRDNPYTLEDQAYEIAQEYPLGISSSVVYRVDISTGGPGDWLEIWTDNVEESGMHGGTINRIVYHFVDWFDHAEVELHGDEFDVAERFVANFLELY